MKLSVTEIHRNPNNPRFIKDANFAKLVQSIKDFPEMLDIRPIVLNKEHMILGGDKRYLAAIESGLKEVPVLVVDLTEAQQKEFTIKDNLNSGDWDWDILANEWDTLDLTEWGLDVPIVVNSSTEVEFESLGKESTIVFTFPHSKYLEVMELIANKMQDGYETKEELLEKVLNV